jgi:hypothetical protein
MLEKEARRPVMLFAPTPFSTATIFYFGEIDKIMTAICGHYLTLHKKNN